MGTRFRGVILTVFLGVLPCTAAFGGPASAQKAMNRRGEARALVEQLRSGDNSNAVVSRLRFLLKFPEEAAWVAHALSEALGQSVDPRQRLRLVQALGELKSPAAEGALLGVLGDADGAVRMAAVQGLGRLGSRAVGPMTALLDDASAGVRAEAARAVGMAQSPKAARRLLEAAKVEGEPEVRAVMLVAVGACGDVTKAGALASFLGHSSESTRLAAAQGLCRLNAPQGFDVARKLLGSTEAPLRRQGLEILEGLKSSRAKRLLAPMLDDADGSLAARAARMLYQAGDEGALVWLVRRSNASQGDSRLMYETELEALRLTDEQRASAQ